MAAAALSLALVLAVPGRDRRRRRRHSAKTIKVSTAKVAGVGTVLTTGSGLTLYRFTEDTPGTSTCTGACAKIWPPLLASKGAHVSGPKGVKGLSVMKVGNGHWQVAFHKIPLYRFEGDKKKGQAHGQNVGKVWFAVLKSGIPACDRGACRGDDADQRPHRARRRRRRRQAADTNDARAPDTTHAGTGDRRRPPRRPAPPPTTTPPTSPPTTTPPTSPPPTTPTTPAGGGGYGY